MHPSIFNAISPQPKSAPSLYKKLTDVQGTPLDSIGRFTFLIRLPDGSSFAFPAFVIKNLSSSCILGADFLRNAKISLNLHSNTASLPDGSIAAITMTTPEAASATPDAATAAAANSLLPILRAGETTTIPAFSSKHIPAIAHFPPGMTPPKAGLVECHGDEEAILNGAIHLADNNKTKVTMLNPTAEPIIIPRGEIVAHISALPEEEAIIQILPATDDHPIAAIQKAPPPSNQTCHICESSDPNCAACTNHIAAATDDSAAHNQLQATSCVTNASWGPRPRTAKAGNQLPEQARSEVLKTIKKLTFKEKQLHLRKNLKVSCTDPKATKQYWALVDAFHDIFSDSEDDLGHTNTIEHNIKLKSNDPIHIKQFRIPFSQRQFIENKVNHLVKQNVLEHSTSPYNTPIFAIPKKPVPGQPQGYRLIQDLRAINEHSLTDKYNLADIKECMDKVGTRNAKIFSSLDLTSGFFQISIKPEARPFTAFTIPGKGKYQWARVCLGLHGAPSTFAKLMSLVMAGLPQAMTYLDDVLVASATHQDHMSELRQCFQRLRKHGLKLNPFKTELAASSVQYLGHTLTADGITVSDLKCKAIENFPVPTSRAAIRQFVGLANFYRPLIKDFNKHSGHLTGLIKDKSKYRNGPMPKEAQAAFAALKSQLIKRPVIAFPDPNKPFHLATDAASGDENRHGGLGAVLTQVIDGQHRTIAYASRSLRDSENNYSAYLLELLAIVWAIDHFSVYLHNTHFTVYTDHKPIPKMAKSHKKTFNRLHQLMNEYNCEIVYRAGKDNAVADALSRNTVASVQQDYKQSPDNIRHLQSQDELCKTIVKMLSSPKEANKLPKPLAMLAPYCAVQDGIVVIFLSTHHDGLNSRIVTPKILRKHIIQSAHCSRFAGHLAVNKTLMRIQAKFWWPLMAKEIAEYIEKCFSCQLTKDPHMFKTATAPIQPLLPPDRPNVRVHADLFGPLVKSKAGNKYILVITDAFSKFTRVIAIPDKTATTVTKAIFNHWVCLFGPMTSLLTDNGKEFANAVNSDLCHMLNINRQFTSSIHPQTNASAETFNKWIIHYMKSNHIDNNEDWEDLLGPMMLAYNSAVHDSTQKSPFFLTFGIDPSSPLFPVQGPTAPLTTPWSIAQQQALKQAHATVIKNINKTRQLMIKAQKNVTTKAFEPNQRILIWYPKSSFTGKGLNAKFQRQWAPGTITTKISDLTYQVLKDGSTKSFTCHVNRLKAFMGNHPTPPSSNNIKERPDQPNNANKFKHTKDAPKANKSNSNNARSRRRNQDNNNKESPADAYQLPDLWPPTPPPRDYDDFSRDSNEEEEDYNIAAPQQPSFAQFRQVINTDTSSDDFVSLPSPNNEEEEEEEEQSEQQQPATQPPLEEEAINQNIAPSPAEKEKDEEENISSHQSATQSQDQVHTRKPEQTPPRRGEKEKEKEREKEVPESNKSGVGPSTKPPSKMLFSTPIKETDPSRNFGDNTMLSSIHESSEEEEDEGQKEEQERRKRQAGSTPGYQLKHTWPPRSNVPALQQQPSHEKAPAKQSHKSQKKDITKPAAAKQPDKSNANAPDTLRAAVDIASARVNAPKQGRMLTATDQIRALVQARKSPPKSPPPLNEEDQVRYPKRARQPSLFYKEGSSSDSTSVDSAEAAKKQQEQHQEEEVPVPTSQSSAIVSIEAETSQETDTEVNVSKPQQHPQDGRSRSATPPPPLPPKQGGAANKPN